LTSGWFVGKPPQSVIWVKCSQIDSEARFESARSDLVHSGQKRHSTKICNYLNLQPALENLVLWQNHKVLPNQKNKVGSGFAWPVECRNHFGLGIVVSSSARFSSSRRRPSSGCVRRWSGTALRSSSWTSRRCLACSALGTHFITY